MDKWIREDFILSVEGFEKRLFLKRYYATIIGDCI